MDNFAEFKDRDMYDKAYKLFPKLAKIYDEEIWDEKCLTEISLYLSEDQLKVYSDGTPFQRPWTGKNLVLLEKSGKYYILGEIRYTPRDFFMFYESSDEIERKNLREFKGDVLRELNDKEKKHVLDILTKRIKFTRDFFDVENGRRYIDLLNSLINENSKIKRFENFLIEGKDEENKMDNLLDKGLKNLSDQEKKLLNFLSTGGLLKDFKIEKPIKKYQKSNTGNLSREQQEIVDYYMDDYQIDLTKGWFIFCLEEDEELQEDGYDHTIYFFPAGDPWFDQHTECEEFFPYELDPEPHMLAEARYGFDGNFNNLKKRLESTGFFRYVPMDERDAFDEKENGIKEDFLFTDNHPDTKILKFSEYRKGSAEYGQLFQDLMMILRLKREEDKESDSVILHRDELKNIDFKKLRKLLLDDKKRRKLGMSFDVRFLDENTIEFYNLGNKESRPWENVSVNENIFNTIKDRWNKFFNPGKTFSTKIVIGRTANVIITDMSGHTMTVLAKVDTGADSSSIDETIAKQLNLPIADSRTIKSALGSSLRNFGECYVEVLGRKIKTAVSITNRSGLKYKMLLGKIDLDNTWLIVDVKKSVE